MSVFVSIKTQNGPTVNGHSLLDCGVIAGRRVYSNVPIRRVTDGHLIVFLNEVVGDVLTGQLLAFPGGTPDQYFICIPVRVAPEPYQEEPDDSGYMIGCA